MLIATTPQGRKQWIVERLGKGADSPSSLMAVLAAPEDRTALLRIIGPCKWELQWIGTCEEAIEVFHRTSPAIVICDSRLADGDWRQLWDILARESAWKGWRTSWLLHRACEPRQQILDTAETTAELVNRLRGHDMAQCAACASARASAAASGEGKVA